MKAIFKFHLIEETAGKCQITSATIQSGEIHLKNIFTTVKNSLV